MRQRSTRRTINQVHPQPAKLAGEFYGLLDVPAAIGPIGGRYAHKKRQALRPDLADSRNYFAKQPDAVFEGSAIVILAMIAKGREELMKLARRHLDTVRNTELLWAAQGRKGPAIAKSEELLREAFETLNQFREEMEL